MPLYSERNIVDEQMQLRLQNMRMRPSNAVWKRIEKNLPADGSLAAKTDYKKYLGLLFIGLLVGAGSVVQFMHQPADLQPVVASKDAMTQKSANVNSPAILTIADPASKAAEVKYPAEQPVKSRSSSSYIGFSQPASSSVSGERAVVANGIQSAETSEGKETLTDLAFLSNSQKLSGENAMLHTRNAGMNHQLQKFVKTDFTGWYVGFGNALNSTWLLSKSILNNNNLSLVPTFGLAFDAHIGYQFLSKWGLEAGWVMHSEQGQQYSITNSLARSFSSSPQVNELSMEYMQFPVTVHYRMSAFSGTFNQPMKVDIYGGFQVDRIINVEETFSGIPSGEIPSVKPLNLSGVAGIDYDLMLPKKPIFFSLGARIAISGAVFSRQQDQALFVNPHNVLFGLHAAVNFTPGKK